MTASDERTRPTVGLLGLGAYTPDRVMANAEWAEHVDTTDEGRERLRFKIWLRSYPAIFILTHYPSSPVLDSPPRGC